MTLVGPTSDFPIGSDDCADPTSLDRMKGETDRPISGCEMYERLRGDQ